MEIQGHNCVPCSECNRCQFCFEHVDCVKLKLKKLEGTGFRQSDIYPMGITGLFTDRMGNVYEKQR